MLVQAGKLDEDQLQKGLQKQKEDDGYIGQTFIDMGFIDPKELNKYISYQLKIPYLQLGYFSSFHLRFHYSFLSVYYY